ncbi:ribosome hibernation-promoting factor, HPF/YfiA family [Sphingomonas sp.]|uniref:ribosome hibernation-promoting factor, HPF/YfiA family n=1 Tax=Sphingomonas sp. TaxID=28214 RepID=UPI00286E10D8|nr:ribosome-associated translation inhibitor RaiA [Sphingomonas sp.]
MDVRVAGHQVDTGESLREHATARIEAITGKFFARAVAANVTFGRGPHNDFTCDIVAPVAQGMVLKAHHRAGEALLAFNGAADRIETQLRRYTKRLKERKNEESVPFVENAGYTVFAPPADASDSDSAASPVIVAETRVDIPDSTVSDAVMLMDLRNTGALMFRNSATGAFNMIYRREDGNIGWVEPHGR